MKSKDGKTEYCVFADPAFANNHGTAVLTTPEKAADMESIAALSNPSLTKNPSRVAEQAKYKIVPIKGKGLGAIATTFIRRGELVMANTPSVVIDYKVHTDLETEDFLKLQMMAVDSLPAYNRQTVLNQSTHDSGTNLTHEMHVERVVGINAFGVAIDSVQKDGDDLVGVFPEIARLNHDCRPNTVYYFDDERFTQFVHAARDIMPGEELTDTYIDVIQSHKSRNRDLRNWGFKCSCSACAAEKSAVQASDLRIKQILSLTKELGNYGPDSRASPQMAELLISLLEQEKLYEEMVKAYRYAAIEWNSVGEAWTAVKYAHLAIEFGFFATGPGFDDMIDLAEDPWNHFSWMSRTKIRDGWGETLGERSPKRRVQKQVDDDSSDDE